MKHLVLTRLNVPRSWFQPDESWLRRRVELFKKYCLPSLLAQTVQDFELLLFLGNDSPKWFVQEFDGICQKYNNIKWFYTAGHNDMCNVVASYTLPDERPLLTTYFDSDDIVAEDFIKGIQTADISKQGFLYYPHGYIYLDGKVLLRKPGLLDGFMTYVEYEKQIKTIFHLPRVTVERVKPRIEISNIPAWCWIFHDVNVTLIRNRRHRYWKGTPISLEDVRSDIRKFL